MRIVKIKIYSFFMKESAFINQFIKPTDHHIFVLFIKRIDIFIQSNNLNAHSKKKKKLQFI